MKRIFIALMFTASLAVGQSESAFQRQWFNAPRVVTGCGGVITVTRGLISYWSFDGNSNDSVGTNNGTITDCLLTNGVKGVVDTAYAFKVIGNNIATPAVPSAMVCSLGCWAKVQPDVTDSRGILNTSSSYADGIHLYLIQDSGLHWATYANLGGSLTTIYASTSVVKDSWVFLGITYDGTNLNIWVNGAQQTPATHSASIMNGDVLGIGTGTSGGVYTFYGGLDNVRYHNVALSADEWLQIYNAEKP
jgi:hypothetical protein